MSTYRLLDEKRGSLRAFSRFDRIPYLPEILVLTLAAVLRFWRLNYHSFWFDEVVSLGWATSAPEWTWDKTFALVEEKHPPLYYLTLHYWKEMLGWFGLAQNDAALRSLGSILGVLTVLGVILLVRRLSGRKTALLAALLTALSPALVWYSQELRMFQPATTAIVWSVVFMAAAISLHRRYYILLCWLGFIGALLYALYSYLFTAFFLPGLGLSLILLCWQQEHLRWRPLLEGCAALAVTTLLWFPLARNAWLVNQNESPAGQFFGDVWLNLWRQARALTLWQVNWSDPFLFAGMALVLGLLLAGILLPDPQEKSPIRGTLVLWIGLPLLIALAMQGTNDNLFKEDRYYLYLAPFVLWAIGRGTVLIARRQRAVGWSSGLLVSALLLSALPPLWSTDLYRENWRGAANYMADYQAHSSGMLTAGVIHVDYLADSLDWYLRQHYSPDEFPTYGLFGGPLNEEDVDDVIAPPLRGIETTLGADTLFLAQSHLEGIDDSRLVEGWLDEHYPVITEQYPTGIRLSGYALRTVYDELPQAAADAHHPDAEIVSGIRLAACEVMTPVVNASSNIMHPPSGWVHVRMWWQATGVVNTDYVSTVRVVGPDGIWGHELQRPRDPLRVLPTSQWTPGAYTRDEADVNLNPSTPPGEYEVEVGLEGSSTVTCGRVTIA